jgi:hypothetical protein
LWLVAEMKRCVLCGDNLVWYIYMN